MLGSGTPRDEQQKTAGEFDRSHSLASGVLLRRVSARTEAGGESPLKRTHLLVVRRLCTLILLLHLCSGIARGLLLCGSIGLSLLSSSAHGSRCSPNGCPSASITIHNSAENGAACCTARSATGTSTLSLRS